jgi:S-adenosylmethionine synthetase
LSGFGHFGRPPQPDGAFSWERTDLVDELRSAESVLRREA